MKKRFVCRLSLLLSVLMVLSLGACSNGVSSGGSSSPSSSQSGLVSNEQLPPMQIDMMVAYSGIEFPQPNNQAQVLIEEYTNTKLNITAYPDTTIHELLPTMIASDELPMMVSFGGSQLTKTYMINAMRSGVFWDLTDIIPDYSNISSIPEIVFKNYALDGRLYGLPKERPVARDAIAYRYDWLQKLGMKEPETLDELYEMLIAFAKDDPNGSGANDTYGSCQLSVIRFAVYNGAPNNWEFKDGSMIYYRLTNEYMEALDKVRELYAQDVFHKEVAILERSQYQALFTEGIAGASIAVNAYDGLKMTQPEADLHVRGLFPSANGTFTAAGNGHNGINSISTKAIKKEEDARRIVEFFDKLGDHEMCNLMSLGIEGIHYNIENGEAVLVPEMKDELDNVFKQYPGPIAVCYPDFRIMPVQRNYLQQREIEVLQENLPYAKRDDSTGLISQTYIELSGDLNTMLNDAETQYYMGIITKEQFQAILQQWRDRGGDAIIAEYTEAYKAANGL